MNIAEIKMKEDLKESIVNANEKIERLIEKKVGVYLENMYKVFREQMEKHGLEVIGENKKLSAKYKTFKIDLFVSDNSSNSMKARCIVHLVTSENQYCIGLYETKKHTENINEKDELTKLKNSIDEKTFLLNNPDEIKIICRYYKINSGQPSPRRFDKTFDNFKAFLEEEIN